MTNEEFEIKVREWEKSIEDIIIDMDSIRAENNLALSVINHKPLCDEFNNLINERRKSLKIANDNPDKMIISSLRAYNG